MNRDRAQGAFHANLPLPAPPFKKIFILHMHVDSSLNNNGHRLSSPPAGLEERRRLQADAERASLHAAALRGEAAGLQV